MQLFLRLGARVLAYFKGTKRLTDQAIETIAALRTVKGLFSMGYLINGSRGEGTIQIGVGPIERWIASSDPVRDEPIRQHTLRHTNKQGWPAIKLLINDEWQATVAEQLEIAA
jgi:hypothetical protein